MVEAYALFRPAFFTYVAPTLEALKWICGISLSRDFYSFASFGDVLSFPCLRRLTLKRIGFSDSSILRILLGSATKVRELEMDIKSGGITSEFFAKRGNIEILETLSYESFESLDFLHANCQLSK